MLSQYGFGQHKTSLDIAGNHGVRSHLNGLNVSMFYHINEALSAGVEMNRFFAAVRHSGDEAMQSSAWDFDLNVHYNLHLNRRLCVYPVTGVSHTSDKEMDQQTHETQYQKFYSINSGLGFIFEAHHFHPYVEYDLTWGRHNQQFLLAGLSFELD